jgi:hypothetical protein
LWDDNTNIQMYIRKLPNSKATILAEAKLYTHTAYLQEHNILIEMYFQNMDADLFFFFLLCQIAHTPTRDSCLFLCGIVVVTLN